jgi:type III secretory pathway component EscT
VNALVDILFARGPARFDAPPALSTWLLLTARVAPSGYLLSLATRGAVPLWLGLAVALALAAGLIAGTPPVLLETSAWALSAGVLREVLVGLAFASAALLPLLVLRASVRLAEGECAGERAPLSTLYALAACALTLSLGGLRGYVQALSQSLVILPLGVLRPTRAALLHETQLIVAQAIGAAIALGLPLVTAIWLLDLTLSLVLRLAHSSEKAETSPLRRALVLGVLGLLCAPWVSRLPELLRAALRAARELLVRLSA